MSSLLVGFLLAAPPQLAVLNGAPKGDAEWELQILSATGSLGQVPKGVEKVTMCLDAQAKFTETSAEPSCKTTVVENERARARLLSKCAGATVRSDIVKESPSSYLLSVSMKSQGQPEARMKARYRHLGPCTSQASPFGGGAIRSLKLGAEQCAQMKSEMKDINPEAQCAGLQGEAKKSCVSQVQQSVDAIRSMCP